MLSSCWQRNVSALPCALLRLRIICSLAPRLARVRRRRVIRLTYAPRPVVKGNPADYVVNQFVFSLGWPFFAMARNSVWITGSAGLIGNQLVRQASASAPDWNAIPLNRQTMDLTDRGAVTRRFQTDAPTLLIHCAAMSQSPQCERAPDQAQIVNVEATRVLTDLFSNGRVVFFSTDLVFNGRKGDYTEEDDVDPLGVYARTKVEAERIVAAHPNHVILRTSLNGGSSPAGNRAFNESLVRAWQEGRTTPLFTDEYRCPIAAKVTAKAAWELALSEAKGVFHVAGAERLNRVEIGERVAARHPEATPLIRKTSLKDYQGPPRAADCSLDISKVQRFLSFRLPGLTEWLDANPTEPF